MHKVKMTHPVTLGEVEVFESAVPHLMGSGWAPVDEADTVAEQARQARAKADELALKAARLRPAPAPPSTEATAERPAKNAPKPAWVEYAVSQRADGVSEENARAEAESQTRDDLISKLTKE